MNDLAGIIDTESSRLNMDYLSSTSHHVDLWFDNRRCSSNHYHLFQFQNNLLIFSCLFFNVLKLDFVIILSDFRVFRFPQAQYSQVDFQQNWYHFQCIFTSLCFVQCNFYFLYVVRMRRDQNPNQPLAVIIHTYYEQHSFTELNIRSQLSCDQQQHKYKRCSKTTMQLLFLFYFISNNSMLLVSILTKINP